MPETTTDRKRQIWQECKRLAAEVALRCGIGDPFWVADKVLTAEEKAEVKALWDTLPGHTCWADAFCCWLTPDVTVM